MIHQSNPLAKRAGMTPSRNYTLFDILLALAVLLFLLVSWNTAGAQESHAALTVTAFIDLDGDGAQSATEGNAAGIAIVATNMVTPTLQIVGHTDAAGIAVLPIAAGRYAVAAYCPTNYGVWLCHDSEATIAGDTAMIVPLAPYRLYLPLTRKR